MKKEKEFDCIKMKEEIQEKYSNEYITYSDYDRNKQMLEQIMNDSLLSKFSLKFKVNSASEAI